MLLFRLKTQIAMFNRTQDSVIAEELYYALKKRGVYAFYSNISISESGEYEFGDVYSY